jgi:hypothetical protein
MKIKKIILLAQNVEKNKKKEAQNQKKNSKNPQFFFEKLQRRQY